MIQNLCSSQNFHYVAMFLHALRFLCMVDMSDKSAWVCLFHGGNFYRHPMLEYVGGKTDLIKVDISSPSYESFIRDIEKVVNTKFEKLYFKFPGKSLEDGLRYIWDESSVVDLLFSYLY